MWKIELDNVSVAFTDRTGGVSEAPYDSLNLGPYTRDDPAAVASNLVILREKLGLTGLTWVQQVHGSKIVNADDPSPSIPVEADGLYTQSRGTGVMVSVADCLPVALGGRDKAMMLHCGWRGLADGIIARGVALYEDEVPSAAIGPGIGSDSYEVGDEVIAALGDHGVAASDGRHVDLRAVAESQLREAGVERIESVDVCTFGKPDQLFSFRRDEETGRQAGVAWLN